MIVSPLGEILAGPNFDGEAILTAEIDLDDIARGKYDFDVVGHYSRPDIFQLQVNERPTPAVSGASAAIDARQPAEAPAREVMSSIIEQ